MNQPQTLSIRIKFAAQKEIEEDQETLYNYHWPRIIAAIMLLTVVMLAIIFTFVNNNTRQQASPQSLLTNKMPAEIDKQTAQIAVTSSPKTLSKPLFSQSDVQIFSPHIKDFVIAKRIKNRQPLGEISDIKFDHNNIATVYAYSKAIGLYRETLYYQWSFNGKQIAKVKVYIGDNRWRSYSRKYISPTQRGDWQVKLVNKRGETLAINNFRY